MFRCAVALLLVLAMMLCACVRPTEVLDRPQVPPAVPDIPGLPECYTVAEVHLGANMMVVVVLIDFESATQEAMMEGLNAILRYADAYIEPVDYPAQPLLGRLDIIIGKPLEVPTVDGGAANVIAGDTYIALWGFQLRAILGANLTTTSELAELIIATGMNWSALQGELWRGLSDYYRDEILPVGYELTSDEEHENYIAIVREFTGKYLEWQEQRAEQAPPASE